MEDEEQIRSEAENAADAAAENAGLSQKDGEASASLQEDQTKSAGDKKNDEIKDPEEKARSARGNAYEWIECVVAALVLCVLVFSFAVRLVEVVGSSMFPTLDPGDKMVVSGLFYDPKPGDIIVFTKKSFRDEPLVKRVIALGGQTVDIDFEKGIVYVDGEAISEPYTAEPTNNRLDFIGPVTVPEGCMFVMGDNRNNSWDSRHAEIGMVDERDIIGKVYITIFPFENFGF